MIPTAVRFAALHTSKATSSSAVQKLGKAAINTASVGAVIALFVGWPTFIHGLETKNHGAGTVPIPEQEKYW